MKTIKSYSILFLFLVAILAASCGKDNIQGDQNVVKETRMQVAFNEVINDGSFNVFYAHDTAYRIIIEAESNLIPHIRTIVNSRSLEIDTRENLNPNYPINIYVTSPDIDGLILNGSGLLSADSVNTTELSVQLSGSGRIDGVFYTNLLGLGISGSGTINAAAYTTQIDTRISGSGNVDISGTADKGFMKISGSGHIGAYNLVQERGEVVISGSGNVYVTVMDYLKVDISGSGSVYYRGNPVIETNISGSGSIYNY